MARTWSLELARDKITVNAVIPTALSPMVATMPMYAKVYEDFLETGEIPHKYRQDHALGSPEDVAPLVVWLSSDLSDNVTGQAIGMGGDRMSLYSHSNVIATSDQKGGWTASRIGDAWEKEFSQLAQSSGPQFPE